MDSAIFQSDDFSTSYTKTVDSGRDFLEWIMSSSPNSTTLSESRSSYSTSGSSGYSTSGSSSIISTPKMNLGEAIGIGVGLGLTFIAVAIIILVLLLLHRKKRNNLHNKAESENLEIQEVLAEFPDRTPQPVKISDLICFLEKRQSDKFIYSEEFKSLPPTNPPRIKSCSDALKFSLKNRYLDILPYNEDRVRLEDPDNDYINASFIDGYNAERAYIATQGPLNTTCSDFWSMVWEQNSNKIIMVANLIEDGFSKCAQYFPKSGLETSTSESMTFDSFVISLTSETQHSDYIVRIFNVTKNKESRTVHQYHYTKWPDKGVPDSSTSLLKFYKVCFSKDEETSGPIIIHCSAGVGRTGTLLAVDILLEQARDKGEIDVAFCVDKMRRKRLAMIQTLTQYVFTHFMLAEMLLVGDVSIPKSYFKEYFSNIHHPVKFNKSMLELQFELLSVSKPAFSELHYTQGTANKHLNRFSKILPIDEFKTFLKSGDGDDKYINAVFVNSHESKDRFIVTHAPLQNSMENFWELVKEYNCSAIIMLNDLLPDEANYWPEDGESKTCGALTIKNCGEISSDNVVLSQLRISDLLVAQNEKKLGVINEGADLEETGEQLECNNSDDAINVRHIRVSSWPEGQSGETRKEALLSMVSEVFQCIERNPETTILVHCMNGAERSGLFCALYCILEKLKMRGEVDIFNSVKKIQKTRPEFIHSTQQLRILYEIADYHLSSAEA